MVKNKKVTVVGIGESGKAAALLLKKKGACVYATDSGSSSKLRKDAEELRRAGVFVEIGQHTKEFIDGSELVIISPGVPEASTAMVMANEACIPVVSEIELASWYCKAPVIGITGTNGKSTVVTLVGLMLAADKKDVVVCGNIGEAFCGKIEDITNETIVVLELSSFQLSRIRHFKPNVACVTNISQNHLDVHSSFNSYFEAKKKIFANLSEDDFLILNYDDVNIKALARDSISRIRLFSCNEKVSGAYLDKGKMFFNDGEKDELLCELAQISLKGDHNIMNILAACLCASAVGCSCEAMREVIASFSGLSHRCEELGIVQGVSFVDDSKSTTVDSTKAALSSCDSAVVLIAGGRDKGSNFDLIRSMIKEKVKAVVLIGEAADKIKGSFSDITAIYEAKNMEDAVNISFEVAGEGDIVLLSPMCASFDMFSSYGERGDCFKREVIRLKKEVCSTGKQ
ncbi:MAG: UDP-N-acetylmuramoyl-L-alanine--D-glutamate ligase [Candidatus Omnitrophota bacterium]